MSTANTRRKAKILKRKSRPRLKPVSLAPLEFEEAVADLLAV